MSINKLVVLKTYCDHNYSAQPDPTYSTSSQISLLCGRPMIFILHFRLPKGTAELSVQIQVKYVLHAILVDELVIVSRLERGSDSVYFCHVSSFYVALEQEHL